MGIWTRFLRNRFRSKIKRTGREIDFTRRFWGHNIERVGDSFAAWSDPRLAKGDVIITEKGRFIVTASRPCGEPEDMTFVDFISESDLRP